MKQTREQEKTAKRIRPFTGFFEGGHMFLLEGEK